MGDLFINTFLSVSYGIVKIFIIALVAGLLVWKKFITQEHIDALSRITVYVFLPCLIFSSIFSSFKPEELPFWWAIPFGVAVFTLAGTGICSLFFLKKLRSVRSLLPLSSMQNAAYLALPIGEFVYRDQFNQFAVYCFLVVLGLSPILWTVGFIMVTNKSWSEVKIRDILSPPLVANLLAILFVLTGTSRYVPHLLSDTLQFMGKATVPAATLILGATLATVLHSLPPWSESLRVLFVKFIIMPVMVILFIRLIGLREHHPLLADVLVIQAATAPATNFILQVRTYGGDLKRVGGLIFISYVVTLVAIPLWLSLWKLL
jgi:predicted permease